MALDDFVEIAKKQDGKDGTTYTTWYGWDDDWCAMFVSWCANEAGILTEDDSASYPYVRKATRATVLLEWYTTNRRNLTPSMNTSSNNYPMVGDIIFVENNGKPDDGPDHVGIVTDVSGDTVTAIEGNLSGIVKYKIYKDLVCTTYNATTMMLGSNHKSY